MELPELLFPWEKTPAGRQLRLLRMQKYPLPQPREGLRVSPHRAVRWSTFFAPGLKHPWELGPYTAVITEVTGSSEANKGPLHPLGV